ncbi:hypothetical protein HYFRA_00008990 [Hymenoscyphus fraxineus]|uniref:Uncharacterized protein n=1 Tax=Hymenoscyphus fraxineus TaxID=746836 RepID=A0A9N9PMU5_9HELO|nr:hypothetical protein HYFRA_00008990 [Hymenoscyphus fraxineus]
MDFCGVAHPPPSKRRRLDIVTHLASEHPFDLPRNGATTATAYDAGDVQVWNKSGSIADGASHSVSGGAIPGFELLECCYGMLSDIPLKLRSNVPQSFKNIAVEFRSPNSLHSGSEYASTPETASFEIQCSRSAHILGDIKAVPDLELQLYCHSRLESSIQNGASHTSKSRGKQIRSWFLNAILFGREDLEEKVGDYLARHKQYLQDPRGCEKCVPYRNPHVMPSEHGEIVMSDSFDKVYGEVDTQIERLDIGPNLLAQLMDEGTPLHETQPSDIIKTPLFPHQKQALTFMIQREEGWALDSTHDIWSRKTDYIGRYINNVNGRSSAKAPPDFRGGLLADDMGLGKTLSMISLIASTKKSSTLSSNPEPSHQIPGPTTATLLVVPPALLQVWEKQFGLHVFPNKLNCHIYHGQNKKEADNFAAYDVVITTYHTLSAIWRKRIRNNAHENPIFASRWYRVVLDEGKESPAAVFNRPLIWVAHTIQNPRSQLSQACFSLHSNRRWAITGTPIQNKLADFASIVKFLQVHPYSDSSTFEEEIFRPWQNRQGTSAQGFLRLKTLVRAITISRTKAVVNLPTRVDEVHGLHFTAGERENYDAAKAQSRKLLDEAISSKKEGTKTFNALSLLNNLRLICNHGLLAKCTADKMMGRTSQDPSANLESLFDGAKTCSICEADLFEDFLEGSSITAFDGQHQADSCEPAICENCKSQKVFSGMPQNLRDGSELLESGSCSSPATPAGEDPIVSTEYIPTKIKALATELATHTENEKCVVFSYWTSTLDLVQLMLKDIGIPYTRIDGNTSLQRRKAALREFERENATRVILVSITCGGAGLDLTAGSRAYLLEPHWNPMIEEQALCRVHRVGQKRNVTTVRFLIRDSFEEQIVELQKRKRTLAQVTFSQGLLSEEGGIGIGTLQYLKQVLE